MAELQRTADHLSELRASQPYAYGTHLAGEPSPAAHGLLLGETRYDPGVHSPDMISLLSLNEMVTGDPYVQQRLPAQPLDMTIVLHEPASNDFFHNGPKKILLGKLLKEALRESRSGLSGHTQVYSVGEAATKDADLETTVVTTSGDPLVDAKLVQDLTRDSIGIVISDFSALPVQQLRNRFDRTVGIKTTDAYDLALPADRGVIRIGDTEVNTDKPRDLARLNEALQTMHVETMQVLGKAGLLMAAVTFDTTSKHGFDLRAADASIAKAVGRLQQ